MQGVMLLVSDTIGTKARLTSSNA